ncbi:hypothetical protein EK904_000846 [Melospiza melodia maxima]|nr:hypothetical protein EK904_000846 [Melospiza melodia maxima]
MDRLCSQARTMPSLCRVYSSDSGSSSPQDLSLPFSSCIPSREDETACAHLLDHTCCHSPVLSPTWGLAKLLLKLVRRHATAQFVSNSQSSLLNRGKADGWLNLSFSRAANLKSAQLVGHLQPMIQLAEAGIYGESSSCAGRALRNIFTLQASDLIKDRVYLTGICRRSCVGSELVDWLLEQCPFVKCRSTAVGVWQLLLDMGIILSVDRQLYFQDSHAFYQFSADECTYLFCEFEKEEAWKNGVKLLLQLLPLSPPRIDMCNLPDQKIEDTAETNAEILARLTSAVQRELAAVIALKARKSVFHAIIFSAFYQPSQGKEQY